MRGLVVLLTVVGCYNPTVPARVPCGVGATCPVGQRCIEGICEGTSGDASVIPDGEIPIDAPDACKLWSAKHFDACALPAPMGDLHLTGALSAYNWDTDAVLKGKMNTTIAVATMVMTQTGGPDILVASVNNFTVDSDANLHIFGSRPLLVAVWGTAMIAGDIEGAANRSTAGPGGAATFAPAIGCNGPPTGDSGATGTPATGGGGGGYQGVGGTGGNTGGVSGQLAPSLIIHGGCAGGNGGAGNGATAARGAGGGALQITARMSIMFASTASIHMGGGGGGGGQTGYGAGGGGGAGGYIGLDAPAVSINGILAANGGGGGGGASDVASGTSGENAHLDGSPALGGAGATTSGVGTCTAGGNGAASGTLGGAVGGSSGCGGGGGGGGAGYIFVWSPGLTVNGTVSPPVLGGP